MLSILLAASQWELGHYQPARELGEDTLIRCRRILSDDHPHTLRTTHILAATQRKLGWYEQAYQFGQDTLTWCPYEAGINDNRFRWCSSGGQNCRGDHRGAPCHRPRRTRRRRLGRGAHRV